MRSLLPILFSALAVFPLSAQENPAHVKVYHEQGKFGGWPANWGVWIWENEILVGFAQGDYEDLGEERHHLARNKTERHLLARSKNGGISWTVEDPGKKGSLLLPNNGVFHGQLRTDVTPEEPIQLQDPIDFLHPDLAFTVRTDNIHAGQSRFWYSYDRGQTWRGPHLLPNFGTPGIAARTDYQVYNSREALLFVTAAKEDGREGRPVALHTDDGGLTWRLLSFLGDEPEGFAIMPASVKLSDQELYVAVRRREADRRFIGAYRSLDKGKTWQQEADPVEDCGIGNPPALVRLQDGRLCLIYGYRAEPYSIMARLSNDGGKSWSSDYVIRSDGASRDMGYPRVVQRPDGKLVILYYFNDHNSGPERYIGASIWEPPLP
ncbi:sialidase family protein [Lunatimonas salinarum]|uniref:sialidase family protein n=1 Tax=Lunatimonas salinarum TaxID=1774590 RepID=UPI001AE05A91|nr:sialidase family protein [Lunatimonas salinarum]